MYISVQEMKNTFGAFKNEKLSKNFWATSGRMAPFYELLKVLSDWLVKRGFKRNEDKKYRKHFIMSYYGFNM